MWAQFNTDGFELSLRSLRHLFAALFLIWLAIAYGGGGAQAQAAKAHEAFLFDPSGMPVFHDNSLRWADAFTVPTANALAAAVEIVGVEALIDVHARIEFRSALSFSVRHGRCPPWFIDPHQSNLDPIVVRCFCGQS